MSLALGTVTFMVPDYDAAIAWFTGVLGCELVEDTPLGGGKRWVLVAPPGGQGARLLLARASSDLQRAAIGNQTGGRVAFFLTTTDFATDHARLTAAGLAFQEPIRTEPYGQVCVFADPWGNLWDLVEAAPAR